MTHLSRHPSLNKFNTICVTLILRTMKGKPRVGQRENSTTSDRKGSPVVDKDSARGCTSPNIPTPRKSVEGSDP